MKKTPTHATYEGGGGREGEGEREREEREPANAVLRKVAIAAEHAPRRSHSYLT